MKKRKKSLILVVLLLLVVTGGVAMLTYSRYLSSATSKGTAKVAPWVIEVNGTDIVANESFTIDDIEWVENEYIDSDYIAPGSEGTFDIEIDATGSKVSVEYSVEIDTTKLAAASSDITIASVKAGEQVLSLNQGKYKGVIDLADVDTPVTLTVTVKWEDNGNNTVDTGLGQEAAGVNGKDLEIPVKVTASQYIEE